MMAGSASASAETMTAAAGEGARPEYGPTRLPISKAIVGVHQLARMHAHSVSIGAELRLVHVR